MILNLKVLFVILISTLKSKISIFRDFITSHHVFLHHIGPLNYVNSVEYITMTDLIRIELLVRSGIWHEIRKRKINTAITGETIQFRKPLAPFQDYKVVTKLLGWDEKILYIEHKFISKKGVHTLMLIGLSFFNQNNKLLSPSRILQFSFSNEIEFQKPNKFTDSCLKEYQINFETASNQPYDPYEI